MKLLLIGGTRFLGRHIVDAARASGHEVTLFNRGRTAPDLFRDVEQLHGDRDGGLDILGNRSWDAVIDTCGYVPRVVRQSVARLSSRARRYVFVSSVSVYSDFSRAGITEDAQVLVLADPTTEDVLPNYGALKAACELVVQEAFGPQALIIRPGLIVGPHDPTERFSYWVRRCAQGGAVLAPDVPRYPIQFIDVRDLAQWTVGLVQGHVGGAFNAVGPQRSLTLAEFLSSCARSLGTDVAPVWVASEFLVQQGVQPWTDLPLWAGNEDLGIAQIDGTRAWAAGLRHRALEETVRDTWKWIEPLSDPGTIGGLSREREAALIAAWALQPRECGALPGEPSG
jgi:2'-hydroxyisoflavone reductase